MSLNDDESSLFSLVVSATNYCFEWGCFHIGSLELWAALASHLLSAQYFQFFVYANKHDQSYFI